MQAEEEETSETDQTEGEGVCANTCVLLSMSLRSNTVSIENNNDQQALCCVDMGQMFLPKRDKIVFRAELRQKRDFTSKIIF